jgi:hypothetical protein
MRLKQLVYTVVNVLFMCWQLPSIESIIKNLLFLFLASADIQQFSYSKRKEFAFRLDILKPFYNFKVNIGTANQNPCYG